MSWSCVATARPEARPTRPCGPEFGPDASDLPATVPAVDDQLLTVAEVADRLRVSTMTIYRLIRAGDLPAVRVGRSYRVFESALSDYLLSQTTSGGEA